jgi:hypothetical protein
MRLALLIVPMIGAGLIAVGSARAADMVPPEPPAAYGPPPVMVEPRPVVAAPVGPAPCWRYGAFGWGWYPCVAASRAYWHGNRYGYGYRDGYRYRGRPYWARAHHWQRSYW